jgi:hypothetical protein
VTLALIVEKLGCLRWFAAVHSRKFSVATNCGFNQRHFCHVSRSQTFAPPSLFGFGQIDEWALGDFKPLELLKQRIAQGRGKAGKA